MQAGCKSGPGTAPYSFVSSSLESPRNSDPVLYTQKAHAPENAGLGLERATAFLSAACAIHCLLMPLVIALLPLVGTSGVVLGGTTEALLSSLVLVSGSATLLLGYRRHRDGRVAALISACLVLYLVGHAHEGAWFGSALAVVAGLGLAGASFWSARLGHAHDGECAH